MTSLQAWVKAHLLSAPSHNAPVLIAAHAICYWATLPYPVCVCVSVHTRAHVWSLQRYCELSKGKRPGLGPFCNPAVWSIAVIQ